MPLDDMLQVLDDEGKEQRADVKGKAKEEAGKILAEAKADAEQLKAERLEQFTGPLSREKAKILNEAKLESKQKLAEAKSRLLEKVQSRTQERITEFRKGPEWKRALQALVKEAAEGVPGKATVFVSPEDEAEAKTALSGLGEEYDLKVDENVVGAVATSEDGRIRFVNTVEARIERAGSHVRPIITSLLFEDGNAG
ncbi:MAG: V-type ATP synthase subunit E [Terriglobia bacterium]